MPTDHRSPITGSALRRIHAGVAERNSIDNPSLFIYTYTYSPSALWLIVVPPKMYG